MVVLSSTGAIGNTYCRVTTGGEVWFEACLGFEPSMNLGGGGWKSEPCAYLELHPGIRLNAVQFLTSHSTFI